MGAGLFLYECFRLLLLVVLLFLAFNNGSMQEDFQYGAFFPYLAFVSPNALFPLMILFVWLRPEEYRSYLSLFVAGKAIGVILFFLWEFSTARQFNIGDNVIKGLILLGGSILLCLTDAFSIWRAWVLKNKY